MSPLAESSSPPATITVPILCRLWEEDGGWQAEAVHLPVVVFGQTFEQARSHLRDALACHVETVSEVGDIEEFLQELAEKSREDGFLSAAEVLPQTAYIRMQAAVRDRELVAVT